MTDITFFHDPKSVKDRVRGYTVQEIECFIPKKDELTGPVQMYPNDQVKVIEQRIGRVTDAIDWFELLEKFSMNS